jgi:hypothetical protein
MTDQQLNASKKSRGRPATGQGLQIVTRVHDDLLAPLDAFAANQAANPDAPIGRPEAVRRIIRDWLIVHRYLLPSSEEDDT